MVILPLNEPGTSFFVKYEKTKKSRPAFQDLCNLRKTFYLAQEMGKSVG